MHVLLKECPVEIQTYNFPIKTPFFTVHFLVDSFFYENVDVPIIKNSDE